MTRVFLLGFLVALVSLVAADDFQEEFTNVDEVIAQKESEVYAQEELKVEEDAVLQYVLDHDQIFPHPKDDHTTQESEDITVMIPQQMERTERELGAEEDAGLKYSLDHGQIFPHANDDVTTQESEDTTVTIPQEQEKTEREVETDDEQPKFEEVPEDSEPEPPTTEPGTSAAELEPSALSVTEPGPARPKRKVPSVDAGELSYHHPHRTWGSGHPWYPADHLPCYWYRYPSYRYPSYYRYRYPSYYRYRYYPNYRSRYSFYSRNWCRFPWEQDISYTTTEKPHPKYR